MIQNILDLTRSLKINDNKVGMKMNNKISVLGTIHKEHYTTSYFSMQILRKFIKNFKPDTIFAELSKEQLHGKISCITKPEYPEIIIPLAKKEKYKIIPIQPNTSKGNEWEQRRNTIIKKLKEKSKIKYRCYSKFLEVLAEIEFDNLRNLQSRKSDLIYFLYYKYTKSIFPYLYKIKEEWNNYLLHNIIEQEKKYNYSRILITVGLSHKFWIIEKLKNIIKTDIIDIKPYL